MYFARVADADAGGTPRIVVASDPASGWRNLVDFLRFTSKENETSSTSELLALVEGGSLTQALAGGARFLDLAAACAADDSGATPTLHPPAFLCPVDPPVYRDFMVFEEHFSFGYRWRDLPTPDVLYEFPVSYLGNPASFVDPGALMPWPFYANELDYELELGIVLGSAARDETPESARERILGVTILNDFSARDIQRREMAAGLGPSKGKNFGSCAGPWIATLDELASDLRMTATVNGELRCDTSSSEMIWSMEEIVAWASAAEIIPAGSLLGSGTANGGSGVEFGKFLSAGDEVSLSVDGLGTLTNTVGVRGSGWTPSKRIPALPSGG